MNGKAVALLAVGSVVAYSGVKGKNISASFKDVLMGQSPESAPAANPITGMAITANGGGSAGVLSGPNSAIAARAMQDQGHPYLFGGYWTNPKGWDCSSASNWWLSRFGIILPGGVRNYKGNWHGPVVANYQLWSGGVSVPRAQVAAGDIVLYGNTHMGIAISNKEFISAQNPANGTRVSAIDGFGLGNPNFKRVRSAVATIGG